MSKNQEFRNAIVAFDTDAADAPILYSTTELNEKGFKALLGRRTKAQFIPTVAAILAIAFLIGATIGVLAGGAPGATPTASLVPLIIVLLFLYRTTFIAVGDEGLDFYFLMHNLGSKYVVDDKMSLPYDKLTNVKKRAGRFNTSFVFEFSHNEKKFKIKTSMPNKRKNAPEQAENMKILHDILIKRGLLKA